MLSDTIQNIHAKYLAEYPSSKISYSLFCRLRPFWVVIPTERDRQTCLCKLHANMQLVVSKLNLLKILDSDNLDSIVQKVSCNVNAKDCMYGDCMSCKDPELPMTVTDVNSETTWSQWKTVKEERVVKDVPKTVTLTVKHENKGTVSDLVDNCTSLLQRFKRHYFNIQHQYAFYRELRHTMSTRECLIHIDFAENYVCKMASEVQSVHYGASKRQISLHTGVCYVGPDGIANTFCSLSENLQHSPPSIWAHMKPVLDQLQKNHPQVDTLHVFSDGPTTQYRQKTNFYLFTRNLKDRGFKFGKK